MLDTVEKSIKPELRQAATMLEPRLYDALADLAQRNERSLAAELRLAIRAHVGDDRDEIAAA
jgi:hypothetical protein